MGYRGRDDWHDMSDYVVHFTKPYPLDEIEQPGGPAEKGERTLAEFLAEIGRIRQQDRTGYERWIGILGSGALKPGVAPLGAGRRVPGIGDSQRVVCFSEIPLDLLDRLIERRSLYGLGFKKELLVAKGGAPLWYLDNEGEQAAIIRAQMAERLERGVDPDDPFWRLTPFIDTPGVYYGRPYRFEWEREWRVIGGMRFQTEDVAFLFLPEEDHDAARQFFADAELEHTGPAYFCPYIDPRWPMDRIQHAVENVPEPPPPSRNAVPWWVADDLGHELG